MKITIESKFNIEQLVKTAITGSIQTVEIVEINFDGSFEYLCEFGNHERKWIPEDKLRSVNE